MKGLCKSAISGLCILYRLASRLDAIAAQEVPKVLVLHGGMRKFKKVTTP